MGMIDRYRGSLLGLAAGDALGTTLEFRPPGSFTPIDDIVGGGPFGLRPGEWTDDTSMALCLAESLLERRGFDPLDQLGRYLRWYREGYLSSRGRCFDIGGTVSSALRRFEATGGPVLRLDRPVLGRRTGRSSPAPVALYYASDPRRRSPAPPRSSRTTHGPPRRSTHAVTSPA